MKLMNEPYLLHQTSVISKNYPNQDIAIGLVGLGLWGLNIVKVFQGLSARLFVYDINPEKKAILSLYPHAAWVDSMQCLLDDKAICAIIIATSPCSHVLIAKKALLHNKHIYIEKPMTINLNNAIQILNLSNKLNLMVMVGQLLHYHPLYANLSHRFNEGDIKTLSLYRLELPMQNYNPLFASHSLDCIWDLGPHVISILTLLIPNALHSGIRQVNVTQKFSMLHIKLQFELVLVHIYLSKTADATCRRILIHSCCGGVHHFTEKRTSLFNPLQQQMQSFLDALLSDASSKESIKAGVNSVAILHHIANHV